MQTRHPKAFIALASAMLLSACDALPTSTSSAEPSQAIGLRAPATLTTSRAVDTQSLYPRVELIGADGSRIIVDMQHSAEDQWSGNTRLMANADYRLAVTWHEIVNDRDLLLAAHVRTIHTGADGARLSLGTDDYDFDADADGDGLNNLQELEAGSDPFDASSGIGVETAVDGIIEDSSTNDVVFDAVDTDVDTTATSGTTELADVNSAAGTDTPEDESGASSQDGTSVDTTVDTTANTSTQSPHDAATNQN